MKYCDINVFMLIKSSLRNGLKEQLIIRTVSKQGAHNIDAQVTIKNTNVPLLPLTLPCTRLSVP